MNRLRNLKNTDEKKEPETKPKTFKLDLDSIIDKINKFKITDEEARMRMYGNKLGTPLPSSDGEDDESVNSITQVTPVSAKDVIYEDEMNADKKRGRESSDDLYSDDERKRKKFKRGDNSSSTKRKSVKRKSVKRK